MFTTRGGALVALRGFAALIMTAVVVLGLSSANASASVTKSSPAATESALHLTPGWATPVGRTTGSCSGGVRCWVNLNRTETRLLGWGPIPPPPAAVARTPLLNAAYYTLAISHRYIARGWYNRGMCVQFVISAIPWEGRGMNGLRC
jgi:hypothetical protein